MVFSCVIDELLQPEDREIKTTIISAQYRYISVLPYPTVAMSLCGRLPMIFSDSANDPSASTGNIPSLAYRFATGMGVQCSTSITLKKDRCMATLEEFDNSLSQL
jgi:hypothetical protein